MCFRGWTALGVIALLGCASDVTGPPPGGPAPTVEYDVALDRCENAPEPGIVHYTCTVRVTVHNSVTPVVGAYVHYAVTLGEITPEYGESGLEGLGSAIWTVTADELQGVASGTLRACAMNISPPTCAPAAVHTQPF